MGAYTEVLEEILVLKLVEMLVVDCIDIGGVVGSGNGGGV